MRLLGEAVHRLRHAVEEERLRLLLAAVAIGRSDQFLGLGHGERGEEVREDRLQRAAQPDVEEVRQVGVADVVVVGRIGGDDLVDAEIVCVAASACVRMPDSVAGGNASSTSRPYSTQLATAAADVCRTDSPPRSPRSSESLVARKCSRLHLVRSSPTMQSRRSSRPLCRQRTPDTPPPHRRRPSRRCRRRAEACRRRAGRRRWRRAAPARALPAPGRRRSSAPRAGGG